MKAINKDKMVNLEKIKKMEKVLDTLLTTNEDSKGIFNVLVALGEAGFCDELRATELLAIRETEGSEKFRAKLTGLIDICNFTSIFEFEGLRSISNNYNAAQVLGNAIGQVYSSKIDSSKLESNKIEKTPESRDLKYTSPTQDLLLFRFRGIPFLENEINNYHLRLQEENIPEDINLPKEAIAKLAQFMKIECYDLETKIRIIHEIEGERWLPEWMTQNQLKCLNEKYAKRIQKTKAYLSQIENQFGKVEEMRLNELEDLAQDPESISKFACNLNGDDPAEDFFAKFEAELQFLMSIQKGLELNGSYNKEAISKILSSMGETYWLVKKDLEKARFNLELASSLDVKNYMPMGLLARFFEECGEQKLYCDALIETAKRALQDQRIMAQIKVINSSSNSAFELEGISLEQLIFKPIKKKGVNELEKTRQIRETTEKSVYSEPLGVISDGKEEYILFLKARDTNKTNSLFPGKAYSFGESLRQLEMLLVNKNTETEQIEWWDADKILNYSKRQYLKRAIDSIIHLQIGFKIEDGKQIFDQYDYETEIEEKVLKREELNGNNVKRIREIVDYLMGLPRDFAHCDFRLEHILDIGNRENCIIDFERAAYANQFFDIAFLLEQAELELSEEEKMGLVGYFVTKIIEKGVELATKPKEAYFYNAVFINLREAAIHGNKSSKHFNEDLSQIHLKRANELLDQLVPNMPLQA